MSNFELIDDYLTNRLGEQERVQFEQQMESDAVLKADVEFQKQILEGVKKARAAQLKAMLNNVPVGGGWSGGLTAGKIAATLVTVGIVGTTLYFYMKPEKATLPTQVPALTKPVAPEDSSSRTDVVSVPAEQPTTAEEHAPPTKPKEGLAANSKPTEKATQPRIEVTDPSDELVDNSTRKETKAEVEKSAVTTSKIAVEINDGNKKYNFHYQFSDGKLMLYGAFDKSLYEILEINGDRRTVFLVYKENYYLLDEKQTGIIELKPISDPLLLRKLKEYHSR